jgi:hypothetical protein
LSPPIFIIKINYQENKEVNQMPEMSDLKINVNILGRHAGTVVRPGERDYDTFANWSEKGSRMGGGLICEPCEKTEEEVKNPEPSKLEDMKNTVILAKVKELDPETEMKGNTKKATLIEELKRLEAEAAAKEDETTPACGGKDAGCHGCDNCEPDEGGEGNENADKEDK